MKANYKMFTIDQDNRTTAREHSSRTESNAFAWFIKRICNGAVMAEPLELSDVEEWDQTLESNPFRALEAMAEAEGYTIDHIAIQGELEEWYGEGYRKPSWRLYVYAKKN